MRQDSCREQLRLGGSLIKLHIPKEKVAPKKNNKEQKKKIAPNKNEKRDEVPKPSQPKQVWEPKQKVEQTSTPPKVILLKWRPKQVQRLLLPRRMCHHQARSNGRRVPLNRL